jgi:hypothetical protein
VSERERSTARKQVKRNRGRKKRTKVCEVKKTKLKEGKEKEAKESKGNYSGARAAVGNNISIDFSFESFCFSSLVCTFVGVQCANVCDTSSLARRPSVPPRQ